ncbi:MAG TPA: helix-turn-helix transcriptional regulator [Solirubrobacterales bacterium]|nr:helix-turn-helix transcriptional regulator [Solirubrobacterales bacterium]
MPPRAEPQVALGQAVKRLREKRGLTQETVAHAAGVHPTWVSRLECGRLNPSWGMVERVAEALGIKPSDLAKAAEGSKKRRG